MGRSAGHRDASVLGATVIVIFLKILKKTQTPIWSICTGGVQ